MKASPPPANVRRIVRQIELSYGINRVRAAKASWGEASEDTCLAILDGASQFASATLDALNQSMDLKGCTVVDGRVKTAGGHVKAWADYVAQGWPTLEAPVEWGGQELPAVLAFAAQELFDRSCPAFGMLPVPQRSAFRLISAYGTEAMKQDWLPRLASGEWGATICVSEVGAGSDLPRIRTRAVAQDDGFWAVTGEKCWISFGDHDLTEQIGHIVLAHSDDGTGRLAPSLFLVPALLASGGRNRVSVRRIEHKLGLHGSPTCALGFEEATGFLLGQVGRGLPQMFVMIANMRLAVGAMGLGIASASADTAIRYAEERKQGGRPEQVPIVEHADVQMQLMDMIAQVELLRGLLFAVANCHDLAASGDTDAGALAAWLLPIVKTSGGEVAFEVASSAIQVLGGAGYTQEWSVEQALRDARVLTIFEGTTGIQAQDLLKRRLLADDSSYRAFLDAAADARNKDIRFAACLHQLEKAADSLRAAPEEADSSATAFLHLAAHAAFSWIAANYLSSQTTDRVLLTAAEHWLARSEDRAIHFSALARGSAQRASAYGKIRHLILS